MGGRTNSKGRTRSSRGELTRDGGAADESLAAEGDWIQFISKVSDGIASQLCRSAPERAHRQLTELKCRATEVRSRKARRALERELDQLAKSSSYFLAASKRYASGELACALRRLKPVIVMLREQISRYERETANRDR